MSGRRGLTIESGACPDSHRQEEDISSRTERIEEVVEDGHTGSE
jgi:hypothetical protein